MLRVSDNKRFLQHADGRPFFYLGDTAWELLHRCTREEADLYLRNRAAKGFTVVQTAALAEIDGLHSPNAYSHCPLVDDDPTKPNEPYWENVDWIVARANKLGLHVGFLPTWGEWHCSWHGNREIFTVESARTYGTWLGQRYRDTEIIWVLGGDRPIRSEEHLAVIRAVAEGLREGDAGRHLISYHPVGGASSSQYVHCEPWLDFHMIQSGHTRDGENFAMIDHDYSLLPIRPCMDAETCYEDFPNRFNPDNGWLDDYDLRKACYWALFAGAHGHTYGCNSVWQMWEPRRAPFWWPRLSWKQALDLPGSAQLIHARRLLESRPWFTRIPDQSIVGRSSRMPGDHVQATRCSEGRYAMLYIPSGQRITLDLTALTGNQLNAHWYSPRDGSTRSAGNLVPAAAIKMQPPPGGGGRDWVLVIDDAAQGFPPPGRPLST